MQEEEKPKKNKNKWQVWLMTLGLLILGLGVGILIGKLHLLSFPKVPKIYYLSWLPLFILVYFVVIAFHELGHTLAGIGVGFQFRMFIVGPFMLEKEAEHIRFKWNRHLNSFGGLALCIPTDKIHLRSRFLKVIAAGPLASLLLGLIGLGLFYSFDSLRYAPSFMSFLLGSAIWMAGVLSGLIFLLTIIPARTQGFFTDGGRILNLLRGGDKALIDITLLSTIAQVSAGTRPRELDPQELEQVLELETKFMFKLYLKGYLYLIYLDRGELEKAEAYLNDYLGGLDEVPKAYQAILQLDQAFFLSHFKKEARQAREIYESVGESPFIPPHYKARTQAGILLAEGNHKEAIIQAKNTLNKLRSARDKGLIRMEKEWMQQIIDVSEQAISSGESFENQDS